MKTLYRLIYIIFLLYGCANTDTKLSTYIRNNCNFSNCDTCCCINLKKALTIDYDTMYIFREYTILSAMRDILGIKNYKYKSSPDALLVEDSHYKIILLKNHEIVYDNDFEHHYTYIENGSIVEGKGIFDGNTITDYALLYTSPIFCVEKKLNDNGKEFYILREIKTQEEDIEKK